MKFISVETKFISVQVNPRCGLADMGTDILFTSRVREKTIQELRVFNYDVAKALGYKDTSDVMKRHVGTEDKLSRRITDSGQGRRVILINESGLYALILSSKPRRGWFENAFLQRLSSVGRWHCQLVADCLLWASSRAWKWQNGAHTGEKSKKDAYFLGCYL